jgi:PleD family two-component response regulator
VSVYEPGDDPERLVGRADEALYQVKRRREESAA